MSLFGVLYRLTFVPAFSGGGRRPGRRHRRSPSIRFNSFRRLRETFVRRQRSTIDNTRQSDKSFVCEPSGRSHSHTNTRRCGRYASGLAAAPPLSVLWLPVYTIDQPSFDKTYQLSLRRPKCSTKTPHTHTHTSLMAKTNALQANIALHFPVDAALAPGSSRCTLQQI